MSYYSRSGSNPWLIIIKMVGYTALITGNLVCPSFLMAFLTVPVLFVIFRITSYRPRPRYRYTF